MKKVVSVHIEIAELVFVVSKIPQDKKAEWLDDFVETLVMDNNKNGYAVRLLKNVEDYKKRKSEKARQSAMARWNKEECERMQTNADECERMQSDSIECETMRNYAIEQNRTEQIRKDIKKETNKEKKFSESFSTFWSAYDRPDNKGSKENAYKQWNKLSEQERELAFKMIVPYKNSQKDLQYMKHAERYLRDKAWEGINAEEPEKPKNLKPIVGENIDLSKWGVAQ